MIQIKMLPLQPHSASAPSLQGHGGFRQDTGHGRGCPQILEFSENLVSKHQWEGEAPLVSNTQGTLQSIVYQSQFVLGEPYWWPRSGIPGVHQQP